MKKKFMFLLLGVMGLFASGNAQPGFPTFNINGILVNTGPGGSFVQVAAGQALNIGTAISYNGQLFAIQATPAPNGNIPIAENIASAFTNYNVVVDGNGNLTNNTNGAVGSPGTQGNGDFFFGTSIGDFTVVAVPFDFGLSAVLGAGAIAAVKTARRRRKAAEVAA
jgi:hypothetical protein